jgi:glycosyltransferase involved in cell wall biosynthesis
VVHEAAAAGMTIIASDVVGAGMQFVRPGVNGYFFRSEDELSLVRQLVRMAAHDKTRLAAMSTVSQNLSRQFEPAMWAQLVITQLTDLLST